jgi:hypothetical protein
VDLLVSVDQVLPEHQRNALDAIRNLASREYIQFARLARSAILLRSELSICGCGGQPVETYTTELILMEERFIDPFDSTAITSGQDVLRDKIIKLEDGMRKQEQIHIEPVHYFADGLYAREITIPKGTLLTGKIHLFEHINIISKGDISVLTEAGVKRIVAPATIISKPGIKRVGYAHEETVWTTVHSCRETDPDKAEELLVVDTFEEFEASKCHLLP